MLEHHGRPAIICVVQLDPPRRDCVITECPSATGRRSARTHESPVACAPRFEVDERLTVDVEVAGNLREPVLQLLGLGTRGPDFVDWRLEASFNRIMRPWPSDRIVPNSDPVIGILPSRRALRAGVGIKSVEALRPERPECVDPLADLVNAIATQRVQLALGIAAGFDEAGLSKHPKVSRHRRPRDVELRCQITGSSLAVAEQLKDPTTSRISNCLKRVHVRM